MRRRPGFMLIATLLICLVLMVLGGGLLTKKMLQYRGATRAATAAQALALAQSGLEDARLKLQRDLAFPPRISQDQLQFSYAETVNVTPTTQGSYEVVVDFALADPPFSILRLTSVGSVGDVRRRLTAEFDLADKVRTQPTLDNPNTYRFINCRDHGGP